MRNLITRVQFYFYGSVACSAISSAAILASMASGSGLATRLLQIAFGILFWLGLLGEQRLLWKVNAFRKRDARVAKNKKHNEKPGIFAVWNNTYGAVADVVFAISLLLFVVLVAIGAGEKILQYILIFLLVLSFRLHCILNGKNFNYIKNHDKGRARKC